jgi:pachytene checkpoint protein 2
LYELNAASLFSKWFSESSHNLSRFFDDIVRIAADSSTFTMILIDEVESLSMSRSSSLTSNEPSDMLRVVNTLLTQIDRLKSFSNILVLTTSNLIEIIDQALIDRADLILFIGPPSVKTTLHIYATCLQELVDKSLVRRSPCPSDEFDETLSRLAKSSHGLSGRTLRKLPMMAFSHVQQSADCISLPQLLQAMHQQVRQHRTTHSYLQQFASQ